MKTQALLLALLVAPFANATSPIPPPLDKDFVLNCDLELSVLVEGAEGRQISYETIRGQLKLTKASMDAKDLARKIRWTRWDYKLGRAVKAQASDLPGLAGLPTIEFYAMGGSDGHIGSFSVEASAEFVAADKASRIGVATEIGTYLEGETKGERAEATGFQRFANRKNSYGLEIGCFLN